MTSAQPLAPGTPPPAPALSTVVVIVTYGRRFDLLRRTVRGLDDAGAVARIVIVDNGAPDPVRAAAIGSPHPVEVIRIAGNIGSAGGFARGIAAALAIDGARYLAILDDDNLGAPGYLDTLVALHREHGGGDDIAFAALRADRPQYRALLESAATPEHRAGSFLGFHLGTMPARLWRRLGGRLYGRLGGRLAPPAPVHLRAVARAPYGGLFLTIAAARRAGPPRADFILYGDDHEFTRRLTAAGVTLYLTDRAQVADIDRSWNVDVGRGSRWIDTAAPAWRIYYAARNHHYLELTAPDAGAMLTLNRWALFARLGAEALLRHRSPRAAAAALAPLRAAVADARAHRLGYNPRFALPGWRDAAHGE